MPRNNRTPRLTAVLYIRSDPRTLARLDAIRGTESQSAVFRRALDRELTRMERAAALAAARTAPAPDARAELDLDGGPTRKDPT